MSNNGFQFVDKRRYDAMRKRYKTAQYVIIALIGGLLFMALTAVVVARCGATKQEDFATQYDSLQRMYEGTRDEYYEYLSGGVEFILSNPELYIELTSSGDKEHVLTNGAEEFSEVPLDTNVIQYIYDESVIFGFDPKVIFAMAEQRSGYDAMAISPTSDYGLFQINESNFFTLAYHLGYELEEMEELILDPVVNCDCMMYILAKLRTDYSLNEYHPLLMAYSMGPGEALSSFRKGNYSNAFSRDVMRIAGDRWGFES